MKKNKVLKVTWKITFTILILWYHPLWGYDEHPFTEKQSSEGEGYILQAIRIEIVPKIDGFLEREIWEIAPAATNFIQKQPAEGKPATENTEVRILYNSKNLYIGIMCYDSEPDKIIANEKKRDSSRIYDNDHIRIMFDTFHDRRNGYIFVINPLGAKLDIQVRKEGRAEGGRGIGNPNINTSWDGVWKVSSAIHEKGWSAEIEIPLVTLRFHERSEDGWGVNILRNIRRKNEESTWVPLPRNLNLYKISIAGELKGLEGLKKGLNLQVKPFVIVDRVSQRNEEWILSSENIFDAGIDFKYGLTSNLTLDVTGNTDFSQVEADDQQINLTRFSLYFPEKRDFFLENSAVFSIGSPNDAMIFFSRRIGISPQRKEIPILGGARIVGKLGRFNVGLINMQTQKKGDISSNNFAVVRLSRDILGKSAIGFMVTNRQSKISGDYNRAFCLDGDFVFGKNLSLSGYFALTSSPDLKGQNRACKLGFLWRSDLWDIYGDYFDIKENFNAEMGFVKRTGIRKANIHVGFTPEPNIPGVRKLDHHIYFGYTTDQNNHLLYREKHVHLIVNLINGGSMGIEWNGNYEFVDYPFHIQEDITVPVGRYNISYWRASFRSDRSRRFYTSMSYRWGGFYGGNIRNINLSTGLRPIPSFATEVSFVYNDVDLPQGDFVNHLLRASLNYNFSTRLALMSFIQWNSDTDEVNINIRLNLIHTPGSDLFIVYNERSLVEGGETSILDRTIAVKFTYLFNF